MLDSEQRLLNAAYAAYAAQARLLAAIDRAQMPGSGFAATPPLPVAVAPVPRLATAPPPQGALGTALPLLPVPVISDLNDSVVTG